MRVVSSCAASEHVGGGLGWANSQLVDYRKAALVPSYWE